MVTGVCLENKTVEFRTHHLMAVQIAAIVASLTLIGLGVFQLLLIMGKPLGEYAWGGQHQVIGQKLRYGSVFAILIYLFMISVLFDRSGLVEVYPAGLLKEYGLTVITVYMILGVFMNTITRSKKERMVMLPVSLVILICTVVIGNY